MILDRTITTNFFKTFLFTSVLFSFIIQIGHLFDRLEVFTKNNVSVGIIIPYLFSMLPLWMMQALPVCTLIAGVVTLGNMSMTGELFCLRSSGVPTRRILRPLFMIAIFLTLFTFLVGDFVMPKATSFAKNLYRGSVDKVGNQKKIWDDIVVCAQGKKRISAKRLDIGLNEMETVTVEEYDERFNLRQALTSKQAEWSPKNGWIFYDGVVRLFSKDGDEIIAEESFTSAQIVLPEKPNDLVPLDILPEELSSRELKEYIRKIESLGIAALKEEVQYYFKFAFPFTHILVLLIGLPIAFKTTPAGGGRGKKSFGRMKSLAVALLIGFLYYAFITIGQALGESRKVPPFLGVWIANIIFAAVGFYLMRNVE